MSKAVLISIQPKWCELIARGKKTVEVRKSKPKLKTPFKCYIYCTLQGSNEFFRNTLNGSISEWNKENWGFKKGKVIGEFVCNEIEELKRNTIFNAPALYSQSCLTRNEYFGYIGNKTAYIWYISDLVIYDKPKELSEFATKCNKNCETGCYDCEYYHFEAFESAMGVMECCRVDGLKTLKRPPQSWCYVEQEGLQ